MENNEFLYHKFLKLKNDHDKLKETQFSLERTMSQKHEKIAHLKLELESIKSKLNLNNINIEYYTRKLEDTNLADIQWKQAKARIMIKSQQQFMEYHKKSRIIKEEIEDNSQDQCIQEKLTNMKEQKELLENEIFNNNNKIRNLHMAKLQIQEECHTYELNLDHEK